MSPVSVSDLAPLRPRLGALFVLRLLLGAAVAGLELAAPQAISAPQAPVLAVVAAYLLVAVTTDLVRQWRGTLPRWAVGAAVLADGVFMAAVLTLGGGAGSGLSFLLYVHLVAVTLLASYRTGLKVAIWQSLLLVVAHYLPPSLTGVRPLPVSDAAFLIVSFLAVAVVTAICSALNESQLRRGRAGFQTLAEMARVLEEVHHPDGVVDVLLRAVAPAFGTRRAAVVLSAPASITKFVDGTVSRHPRAAGLSSALVAQCFNERGPALRKVLHPEHDAALDALLPNARNVIAVPLTAEGEPVGALVVEYGGGTATRVQASTVSLLVQFAAHAALAIRNARLLAEVQRLAAVDGLTGLANRRTFEAALQREVARSQRTGDELSLLLVDVDHFKKVNDQHGHPMGDAVLRYVGRVLSALGREVDLPARYGGEEFAVLLPACPADEAIRVAERLRAGIAAASAPVPVTASVGIAAFPRNAATGEALVQAADAALYDAKQGGRDRVVAAGSRLRAVG